MPETNHKTPYADFKTLIKDTRMRMHETNYKTHHTDLKTLIKDAQELLRQAGETTGAKAEELRAKGLAMLEDASLKAYELQEMAIQKGKTVAKTSDEFVHEHPWKAVGIGAGVGLIVGLLISRR